MKQYIIDINEKDKSHVQTFTLPDGTVAYTNGLSVEEYISSNPDKQLKVITEDEMVQRYLEFTKELQEPYVECTAKNYDDMLSVVPPKRMYNLTDTISMFFVGEAYSGSLYSIYIYDRFRDKYYTAVRDILLKDDELLEDFLSQTKNINTGVS